MSHTFVIHAREAPTLGASKHRTSAVLVRGVLLRRNTAPLWFWRSGCDAALGSSAPGRFLIPAGVTLSNAVSRSLPRSLCLSICQSAVSHCFIPPPPPPPLGPSVCQSAAHSLNSRGFSPHLHTSLPARLTHLHYR